MAYVNDKMELFKKNVMTTVDNMSGKSRRDAEKLSAQKLEKVKKTVQENIHATKEDYKEIQSKLDGVRAELTYMESILEDGEGYENLRNEVRANQELYAKELKASQEAHAKEVKEDILALRENINREVDALDSKIEEKINMLDTKLDEAKKSSEEGMNELKLALDKSVAVFKEDNQLALERSIEELKADNCQSLEDAVLELKEDNAKTLDDITTANEKEIDEIKLAFDERLDVFKEGIAEEVRNTNEDFRKSFLDDMQESSDKNKKTMTVIMWLLIVNTCFLLAILYFIVDTLQLF